MTFSIEESKGKKEYSIDGVVVSESEYLEQYSAPSKSISEAGMYINKKGEVCIMMPSKAREITINIGF